jgi:hypothetical protein
VPRVKAPSIAPLMAAGTARSAWAATPTVGGCAVTCKQAPSGKSVASWRSSGGLRAPDTTPGGWAGTWVGHGGAGTEARDGAHLPHPHRLALSAGRRGPGPPHTGAAGSHLCPAGGPERPSVDHPGRALHRSGLPGRSRAPRPARAQPGPGSRTRPGRPFRGRPAVGRARPSHHASRRRTTRTSRRTSRRSKSLPSNTPGASCPTGRHSSWPARSPRKTRSTQLCARAARITFVAIWGRTCRGCGHGARSLGRRSSGPPWCGALTEAI